MDEPEAGEIPLMDTEKRLHGGFLYTWHGFLLIEIGVTWRAATLFGCMTPGVLSRDPHAREPSLVLPSLGNVRTQAQLSSFPNTDRCLACLGVLR